MARAVLKVSDEADSKGLKLGRAAGKALGRTLKHMINDVAENGKEIAHGEYLIAYAIEKAEGMYMPKKGQKKRVKNGGALKLEWHEPKQHNIHIEVSVRDKADGRMIPGLDVEVTVMKGRRKVGTHRLPMLWHPYLYHYGRNWRVPGDGKYDLRVRFPAPLFHRHDRKNGRRFTRGADVTFRNVTLETGQD